MVIAIVGVMVECRRGKRSIAMTVEMILFGLGVVIDRALPIVASDLASLADKQYLNGIGLLIVIVTWWVEHQRKKEVS